MRLRKLPLPSWAAAQLGRDSKCSIVIPAYNVENYLAEAIESALGQTHAPIEIIVVNDGSTDRTHQIMAEYASQIVEVHQKNGGLSAARNAGIRASTGEVVGLLDADDRWDPRRVQKCLELLASRPRVGFVTTDAHLIDEQGTPIGRRYYEGDRTFPSSGFAQRIVRRNFVFSSTLIRRALLELVGGFDETLNSVEDYDMWLRLLLTGAEPALVDEPLADYRIRSDSLSADRTTVDRSARRVLQKNLPQYWEHGIFGRGYDAWSIGMSLLERGERRRGAQFLLAAVRDPDRSPMARARTAAKLAQVLATDAFVNARGNNKRVV